MAPRRDKGAEPAGGPEATRPAADAYKPYKETPTQGTRPARPKFLRERLKNFIGLIICVITNKLTAPWEVHTMHVVARSLETQDEETFLCFCEHVGQVGADGKRRINLDHLGNTEFGHITVHSIFDGKPFNGSDESEYGSGDWAFAPADFAKEIEHIVANRGKNYRELYPMEDGPREFIMYGFPNKHQHVFGRYSDSVRTYERSLTGFYNESSEGEHAQSTNAGPTNPADNPNVPSISAQPSRSAAKEKLRASYEAQQLPQVQLRRLEVGDQGFRIVSHLNPVFVIFDYTIKMRWRISHGFEEDIPPNDLEFYWTKLWPAVKGWFAPAKKQAGNAKGSDPHPKDSSVVASQSEAVPRADPVTPVRGRPARSAPTVFGISSSPLTDLTELSSPCGPDTSQHAAMPVDENGCFDASKTPRVRFSNAVPSSRDAPYDNSSDVGDPEPSTPTQSGASGNVLQSSEKLPALQPGLQQHVSQMTPSASSAQRSVHFADEDDNVKDDSNDIADPTATDTQSVAHAADPPVIAPAVEPAAMTAAEPAQVSASQPVAASPPVAASQPVADVQPQLRRTTRSNAGRRLPPNPPASRPLRAAPKRSGKAKATTVGASDKSTRSAPSTSGQGSRIKATGDKRGRDDIPSDDDAEPCESDDVPQTKKTRTMKGKVRADDQSHAGPHKSHG
ncbi:hypothetical protein HDZ31DRAFT_65053 [Schizophyllum fasciatum]